MGYNPRRFYAEKGSKDKERAEKRGMTVAQMYWWDRFEYRGVHPRVMRWFIDNWETKTTALLTNFWLMRCRPQELSELRRKLMDPDILRHFRMMHPRAARMEDLRRRYVAALQPFDHTLPDLTYRCTGCGDTCLATREEIEQERMHHDEEVMTDEEVVNLFAFCKECAGIEEE